MLRALRVSRLTICPLGQPEKAIGLEPQIEPWLAIYNHTACLRQKSMGLVYASAMNLRKRKITAPPLYELGWMAGRISSLPPVAGELFLLTSPFIERAYSLLTGGLVEAASGGVGVGADASVPGCAFGSRRSWTHSSNLLIPSAL